MKESLNVEENANLPIFASNHSDGSKSDTSVRPERQRGGAQTQEKRRSPYYWKQKCLKRKGKWTCEEEKTWRAYAKLYAEKEERLDEEDKFKRRKPAAIPIFPRIQPTEEPLEHFPYFPLSAFHEEKRTELPSKLNRDQKIRIWRNMRTNTQVLENISPPTNDLSEDEKISREEWNSVCPCTSRDIIAELKERLFSHSKRRRDLFPCDKDETEEKTFYDAKGEDFSDRKELGHARVPATCPDPLKELLVDRSAGENPGLVDGDYLLVELSGEDELGRAYANVCLRGLKGMHLPELGPRRNRQKTWKFCFYQAVVALLAKTQLRYKYARSANIDYIYEHGWMLFVHIGTINLNKKQRFDDIVVYNYKYSVELELVDELMDVPVIEEMTFDYTEPNLTKQTLLARKELMDTKWELGWEKVTDTRATPLHDGTRRIEEWFDKLPSRYRNCIFRTSRFSLAFWQDGLFWYLYNPYRCDEFGLWDDDGYACILKFCTKASLKRHLMILLVRAYAYQLPGAAQPPDVEPPPSQQPKEHIEEEGEDRLEDTREESAEVTEKTEIKDEPKDDQVKEEQAEIKGENKTDDESEEIAGRSKDEVEGEAEEIAEVEGKFYTVQIFSLTYHCCQVHNLKVLQRGGPRAALERAKKKPIEDCPFDPLDARDLCSIEVGEADSKENIEKPSWLKLYKASWARYEPDSKKNNSANDNVNGNRASKPRWHEYIVEESNKLFSLWGEIHITDGVFERENRGLQSYACYVVCAGMTRMMAPEYWTPKTLDVIVMCGDRYYAHSRAEAEFKSTKDEYRDVSCWSKYLSSHFKIGETLFEAKVLPAICGRLYARQGKSLWRSVEQMFLRYHFGILTCESSCLGLFKFCGTYYMCDVNSYGPPLFAYGRGAAYVLRASYFFKLLNVLVLSIGSPECSRFALNPIEILKVVDVGPQDFPVKRTKLDGGRRGRSVGENCPYAEEKKKRMKSWRRRSVSDKLFGKGG